jgi:hypothetical protein
MVHQLVHQHIRAIMVIKKIIKAIIILILIIIILPKIIIELNDNFNQVSYGDYRNFFSKLNIDKTSVNLNENIQFDFLYKYSGINKAKLNICSDENNVSIIISPRTPIKLENLFPKEYQVKNVIYDNNDTSPIFEYTCPKDLIVNSGLIDFDKIKKYKFNFQLKFIKRDNEYFLSSGDMQMKLNKNASYYFIYLFVKESIMSSGELSTLLGRYVYMNIKDSKLYIYTPMTQP